MTKENILKDKNLLIKLQDYICQKIYNIDGCYDTIEDAVLHQQILVGCCQLIQHGQTDYEEELLDWLEEEDLEEIFE